MESYDRELVVGAFRSGARGIFCIADSHFRELCKCIQRVATGQIWANTLQMNYLIDSIAEVPSMRVCDSRGDSLLTPREQQVVALVSEGLSNRQVARELILSEHTVKKYLFRIFEKLGSSNRVELVLYAVHHASMQQSNTEYISADVGRVGCWLFCGTRWMSGSGGEPVISGQWSVVGGQWPATGAKPPA